MFASIPSDILGPSTPYDANAPQNVNSPRDGASSARMGGVHQHRPPEHGALQTLRKEQLKNIETQLREGPNGPLIGAILDAIRTMPHNDPAERDFVVSTPENMGGIKLTDLQKTFILSTYDDVVRSSPRITGAAASPSGAAR